MNVVLCDPEIPWNTGSIGRTCVATGSSLHLVGKLGFSLEERQIRRSGLDYWTSLKLVRHENFAAFENSLPENASLIFFSTRGARTLWEAPFERGSFLIFGSESRGLPDALLKRYEDRVYRIPISGAVRSLNLSTAAAVALYEGLRRNKAVT
ncbi:MAG: tRNA (cytidine(34)-2'-O)-methyltransferase [Elusimicrobia bacterium]|nr:tRNA (cytidine(34)-2'-O)-methyltransferase [Elusimicrobiota bacterium]